VSADARSTGEGLGSEWSVRTDDEWHVGAIGHGRSQVGMSVRALAIGESTEWPPPFQPCRSFVKPTNHRDRADRLKGRIACMGIPSSIDLPYLPRAQRVGTTPRTSR
jgi:hypothetical protein